MTYKTKNRYKDIDELFKGILKLENIEECYRFFEDICTISELKSMAQRLHVAKLLRQKKIYADIRNETGASTTTITRISAALDYGSGGYSLILDKLECESKNEK